MHALLALFAGLVFGAGLLLSGMAQPAKVLGFLDFTGDWDPSLAFTMAGAIGVYAPAFYYFARRGRTLEGRPFQAPLHARIDPLLLVGAALFGVGWGIAGFCPAPALVSAGSGAAAGVVFTLAMLAGSALHEALRRSRTH